MSGRSHLRQLFEDDYRVTAYCLRVMPPDSCGHGGDLDLELVAAKLGWDYEGFYAPPLQRLLRCSKCGSRGATFIVSPPAYSLSSGGREAHDAELTRRQRSVTGN